MAKKEQLISIGEILNRGWKEYVSDWKKLLEIAIRFLFAGLIQLAFALVADRLPEDAGMAVFIIGSIIAYVIILQSIIVLIDYIMQREQGLGPKAAPKWKLGLNLFWSYIWITLLVGLATIGGLLLFVLPGIWLSILFGFSAFVLIDEKKKGAQAMARSAELVKGRWWKTLWRLLVPSIVIVLITIFASVILTSIVSLFSGGFEDTVNFLASRELSPLGEGINAIIDSIITIVVLPLATLFQVKLYTSLKKTEG